MAKDSILHLILMADADQRTEEPTFAANLELLVMQRIKEEPLKVQVHVIMNILFELTVNHN